MKHPYHQFTFHRNTVRIAAAGISLLIGLAPMQTMAQVRGSQETWQVVQTAKKSSKGKEYYTEMSMSKSAVYDQLVSEYGEQFTADEAQYAIDHLDD